MDAKHLLPRTDVHFVTKQPQTYKCRRNISVVRIKTFSMLIFLFGILPSVYGQDLKLEWAKMNASRGSEGSQHVDAAVDPQNNVLVCGLFSGRIDLNPEKPGTAVFRARTTSTRGEPFVVKYTEKGEFTWAITIDGESSSGAGDITTGSAITVDKSSNVLLAGYFYDTIDFDPGPGKAFLNRPYGSTSKDQCGFVTKYDSNGKYIWGLAVGPDVSIFDQIQRYVHFREIASDATGNVFVTGTFSGKVDFDPGPDTAFLARDTTFGQDAFFAKYDVDGKFQWVKKLGGNGRDNRGLSVAIDTQNNVFFGGWMSGTTDDLGAGQVLISSGLTDGFLIKYDNNGGLLWATEVGGPFVDFVNGLAADIEGNVYASGAFSNVVDFDSGLGVFPIISNGGYDAFVAKYDGTGKLSWAAGMGGMGNEEAWGVASDAQGNVLVTGSFQDTADFDPGPATALLTQYGSIRANGPLVFMAKYDVNGKYKWCGRNGSYTNGNLAIEELGRQVTVDKKNNIYFTGVMVNKQNMRLSIGDLDPTPDTVRIEFEHACGYLVKFGCGDTSSTYLKINECSDHFNFRGEVYTQNGIYTKLVPSQYACDSIFTLELKLSASDTPVISVNVFQLSTVGAYKTYQWLKNGELIPGAIKKDLIVTENGDYEVIVTNEFGCESKSEIYKVTNYTAIDQPHGLVGSIYTYPNPTTGELSIHCPVFYKGTLWTLDGRKVMDIRYDEQIISLKSLTKGIYLLHLSDASGNTLKYVKVIKL